ncbi:MAG: YccF domain-containing protein [bacterium]|nr:YccF domain-containing protein [bacterium]
MSLLGNILWIIFGGIFIFLHYIVAGVLMCLTIIGIPFGLQIFKMAHMSLLPFGKKIVDRGQGSGCLSLVMNILWLFLGGLGIAIHHFLWALLLAITIVGIPFASQHIKLAGLALFPFGKEIR